MYSQSRREGGWDPMIQVEAVVQEQAKGQEASRESVDRMDGPEVQIVNHEQKKQETKEGQVTPRLGTGEARRSTAEAVRTRRSWSPQRTFSLPIPRARFSRHGRRLIVSSQH